jgi:hypothetical protein
MSPSGLRRGGPDWKSQYQEAPMPRPDRRRRRAPGLLRSQARTHCGWAPRSDLSRGGVHYALRARVKPAGVLSSRIILCVGNPTHPKVPGLIDRKYTKCLGESQPPVQEAAPMRAGSTLHRVEARRHPPWAHEGKARKNEAAGRNGGGPVWSTGFLGSKLKRHGTAKSSRCSGA